MDSFYQSGTDIIDRQIPEVDYVIGYLKQADGDDRNPAEEDVAAALDELFTLYTDGAEAVRFKVINRLAGFNYGDSISLLSQALRCDPSPLVRHEAAFALGQLNTNVSSRTLTEVGLSDSSYLVRHEAAMR